MIEVDAAGKRAVLRDLNSLNGCFVNNVRIKGQREALSHGDNVRFGFDTRIWTVDCSSAVARKTPPKPTSSPKMHALGWASRAILRASLMAPTRFIFLRSPVASTSALAASPGP